MKRALKVVSGGAAAIVALTVMSTGTAQAAQSCDYAVATGKYSCSGPSQVKGPRDVIGAKVFDGGDYGGDALTFWLPKPCVKDGKMDYMIKLGSAMSKKISSVEGWGGQKNGCWVWLYFEDGSREGPFQGNVPDVGTSANNRAVQVGLS